MKPFLLFGFLLSFSWTVYSQQNTPLDDLKFYADVMANAGNPIHKERASKEFSTLFDKWVRSDAFNMGDLESIQWLSVKKPEDESFTVVTWQLELGEKESRYFGYLLKGQDIIQLNETNLVDDLEYDVLSSEDWAGALYYNIHTVIKNGKSFYILFGYNALKGYEHRKVAEVLTFEEGQPVFGSELFKRQEEGERGIIKNRLVLDYSSDSNVSLNYNPSLGMIVHDHLIPRMGRIPGQGPTLLPDGSYIGYKWDGEFLCRWC